MVIINFILLLSYYIINRVNKSDDNAECLILYYGPPTTILRRLKITRTLVQSLLNECRL